MVIFVEERELLYEKVAFESKTDEGFVWCCQASQKFRTKPAGVFRYYKG
jgi:hypothetical protein